MFVVLEPLADQTVVAFEVFEAAFPVVVPVLRCDDVADLIPDVAVVVRYVGDDVRVIEQHVLPVDLVDDVLG